MQRWNFNGFAFTAMLIAGFSISGLSQCLHADDALWVTYEGNKGPGKGKHVVLISGDEEYRSEEALPQLGKILAVRHGFKCTVLFAINPETGAIDPDYGKNVPGLESLENADLMIIATRFRDLPDDQMKHIVDYVKSGRPVIGMRTATHAFNLSKDSSYYSWTWRNNKWEGGFGRQVLGETWISHHGHHGKQSTRGILNKDLKEHPILWGIADGDIWGPTDVYGVRLPQPDGCKPLVYGQILTGMKSDDPALDSPKNAPMMPVAWTKSFQTPDGKPGRAFTTTMGASQDLESEGFRRLMVNAVYWAVGLEKEINESANVNVVGDYQPTPFGFGKYAKGVKPSAHEMKSTSAE